MYFTSQNHYSYRSPHLPQRYGSACYYKESHEGAFYLAYGTVLNKHIGLLHNIALFRALDNSAEDKSSRREAVRMRAENNLKSRRQEPKTRGSEDERPKYKTSESPSRTTSRTIATQGLQLKTRAEDENWRQRTGAAPHSKVGPYSCYIASTIYSP